MAERSGSLLTRRLRALGRRLSQGAGRLIGLGCIEGFVDGCVAGEIRGWAMDPRQPNRRVHVLALCEGRVVAEALADLSRMDLIQDGRGDGRHAFRLRLPPALLDGSPRNVRIEAVAGGPRTRLLRGEIAINVPDDGGEGPRPAVQIDAMGARPASVLLASEPPAPMLVVWGEGDQAAFASTRASAEAQSGPAFEVIEIRGRGETQDETLASRLASAHAVAFARAGDALDPALAQVLTRTNPLGDVITWDGADGASRRPEARALGVLLGESLGGAFAVRGHALSAGGRPLIESVLDGDIRRLEALLAARPELRWRHVPVQLTRRAEAAAKPQPEAADAAAPPGYRRRSGGLVPDGTPGRWSVGLWPQWSPAAERSLRALLALAPPTVEIEALVDAAGVRAVQDRLEQLAPKLGPGRLSARALDAPPRAGAGGWMQAIGAAATGELVLICQAGVTLEANADALEDLACWTLSPLVGAVTPEMRSQEATLAGLAVARRSTGWATRSAYEPALAGRRRPVLGAPAAMLAISRAKLAALGGLGGDRLDGACADLWLALRLRRGGAASLLVGDLSASWTLPGSLAGEADGAALAAFEAEELAGAACAYPAPEPAP